MLFTELLPEPWGNIVNVVAALHLAALSFWAVQTFREVSKPKSKFN
jgi:hypothetical protein